MKNYFDFQLKGRQLLLLWIIFYLICILPYCLIMFKIRSIGNQHDLASSRQILKLLPLYIPLVLAALIWSLYFLKMIIQGISLKEIPVKCDYKLGKYLGVILLGFFLTIITLGIYGPWFMRNLQRFYIDNASYKDINFSFLGKGGRLFVIILLSMIIPMILIIIIMVLITKACGTDINNQSMSFMMIRQLIMFILLVPYMYLVYKWGVDVKYAEYHLKWDTRFFPSVGKILVEVVLSIITFGIYFPLAYLRLYKYFAERTKSNIVDNQIVQFGYDIDQLNDFLFVWGQLLLTIITLGIYYPWAMCKIGQRVLSKTFIEKINN
jgi:uncharacterized membrane protein YjgN (DUF898 family)